MTHRLDGSIALVTGADSGIGQAIAEALARNGADVIATPDRITVNAIAPGLIRTPMTAARVDDPDKRRQAEAHIPLGRPGEPEEVAALAAWLASPAAAYFTGQSL